MSGITLRNIGDVTNEFERLAEANISSNNFNLTSIISAMFVPVRGSLLDPLTGTVVFAGFDSVEMRAKLLKRVKPNLILFGLITGLVCGNNIDRIKRNPKFKKYSLELISQAELKSSLVWDFKAVTLSRMIACFPELVAKILHNHHLPMAVEYTALLQIHKEYPSIARHQVVANIIPTDIPSSDIAKILDVLMVPYLLVSEHINQTNGHWKKKKNQEKAIESSFYLNNSFNSKVLSESKRTELSIKYGIIVDKSISAKWNSVSQTARNWLQKNYSFDHQVALD